MSDGQTIHASATEVNEGIGPDPAYVLESEAKRFGLRLISGKRSAPHNAAVGGAAHSHHLTDTARDFAGDADKMSAFHRYVGQAYPELAENIHGSGDHTDHVHVAWNPQKTIRVKPDEVEDTNGATPTVQTPMVPGSAEAIAELATNKHVKPPTPLPPFQEDRGAEQQFEAAKAEGNTTAIARHALTLREKGYEVGQDNYGNAYQKRPEGAPQAMRMDREASGRRRARLVSGVPPASYGAKVAANDPGFFEQPHIAATGVPWLDVPLTKVAQGAAGGVGSVIRAVGQVVDDPASIVDLVSSSLNPVEPILQLIHPTPRASEVFRGRPLSTTERARVPTNPVYRAGQAISENAGAGADTEDTFLKRLPRMAGGFAPIVAAGVAGPGGPVAVMAAQTRDALYQDASAKGATEQQASDAATQGTVLGTALGIIPGGAAARVPEGLVKTIAREAALGGAIGGGQKLGENVIANTGAGYDPERSTMEGVPQAAAEMAVVGPMMGLMHGKEPVPETHETLTSQLDALRDGRSQAVLVTKGAPMPASERSLRREGLQVTQTKEGAFIHRPEIRSKEIRSKVKDGTHGELLGYVERKPAEGEPAAVVTAKDPETGGELKTAVVSPEAVPAQADMFRVEHPDAVVEAGPPEKAAEVIAGRVAGSQDAPTIHVKPEEVSDAVGEGEGLNRAEHQGVVPGTTPREDGQEVRRTESPQDRRIDSNGEVARGTPGTEGQIEPDREVLNLFTVKDASGKEIWSGPAKDAADAMVQAGPTARVAVPEGQRGKGFAEELERFQQESDRIAPTLPSFEERSAQMREALAAGEGKVAGGPKAVDPDAAPTYNDELKAAQKYRTTRPDDVVAPQEPVKLSPELKQWLGDSKVTDEKGSPQVLYHGTQAEWDTYDTPSLSNPKGGIYLTDSLPHARLFGEDRPGGSESGHTKAVYAKIENPMIEDAIGQAWRYYQEELPHEEATDQGFRDFVLSRGGAYGVLTDDGYNLDQYFHDLTASAKRQGHDGVIADFGGMPMTDAEPDRPMGKIVIAFSADQIRPVNAKSKVAEQALPPTEPKGEGSEPHHSEFQPRDEGRFDGAPEYPEGHPKAEGSKERSLPNTLAAAGLEPGTNRTYEPQSMTESEQRGRAILAEQGLDGAIQFAKHADVSAETTVAGFAAIEEMQRQAAEIASDSKRSGEAEAIMQKAADFAGDFAEKLTRAGQMINAVKLVEKFSPERQLVIYTRLAKSAKHRNGKGPTGEEAAYVLEITNQLGAALKRNEHLDGVVKEMDAAKASASGAREKKTPPVKQNYEGRLKYQSDVAMEKLRDKLGKLDFGTLKGTVENPRQVGAIRNPLGGELPGDAELLAQYTAGRLTMSGGVADLNAHLVERFGPEVEPYLPAVRKRAYAIRQEARVAEIENRETPKERRKTILQDIQGEIREGNRAVKEGEEAKRAEKKAEGRKEVATQSREARERLKQENATRDEQAKATAAQSREAVDNAKAKVAEAEKAEVEAQRRIANERLNAEELAESERKLTIANEAREELKAARAKERETARAEKENQSTADAVRKIQEGIARDEQLAEDRMRAQQAEREYRAASTAEKKSYRENIRTGRKAEKEASFWDAPLRTAATEARERLSTATDPQAAMDDLVSVASAMLLPDKPGGAPRTRAMMAPKFYVDLKAEFPDLVTKKNQGEILKRAVERVRDTTEASREAARLRSAQTEESKQWTRLGIDTDAQAILIQRAEAQRQVLEARASLAQEFNRVSTPKWRRVAREIQSIPRALQGSIDAPIGRQGIFYSLIRPIRSGREVIPATFRGYTSWTRAQFAAEVARQQAHPRYDLGRKAKLDITEMAGGTDPRIHAEEQFQSSAAEKLPWVRLSEQGFNLPMNAQRLAMFDWYSTIGESKGYTWENNPEFFEQAARRVNIMTGRGSLSQKAQTVVSSANWLLYSARLQVSRVQAINELINPHAYIKADPAMRKIMAGEALRTAIAMSAIFGTAKALGLGVTVDPDDPDFGKVRVGNTRYDVTGGEAGTIRIIYRLAKLAAQMTHGTPEDKKADAKKTVTVAEDFARKKLAPWPQFAWSGLSGEDAVHQPTTWGKLGYQMVSPMIVGDMVDAAQKEGWVGVAKTTPGLTGLGVSTYTSTPRGSNKPSAPARPTMPARPAR